MSLVALCALAYIQSHMSTIKHCDKCKKKIDENAYERFHVSYSANLKAPLIEHKYECFDFCLACAKNMAPKIIKLLKSK